MAAAAVLLLLAAAAPALATRHLSPESPSSTLDVAASLSAARAAISPIVQELTHQTLSGSAGGSLALRVQSRDFLPSRRSHGEYASLVAARLHRDRARAARIALAVAGVRTSDLQPMPGQELPIDPFAASAIAGPVISGVSQGSGEYFARVGIGSPSRDALLVVDTGSDVTWLQCQPCSDCYQQSGAIFDPSSSSSYAVLPCDHPKCRALDASACRNSTGACLYEVAYGDGSYTVGDFATETISLGSSPAVPGVAIGCGHDNEGLFVAAAGLLALGGGPLSFPSQVAASSLSYCLVDRDSPQSSTLELSSAAVSSGDAVTVTAPLLRSRKASTFYYVDLNGISVGGKRLDIPASAFAMDGAGGGGVIIDSGTAVTRLQSAAYAPLREAFVSGAANLRRAPAVSLFDTCYDLSSESSVEVPAVWLHFAGGGTLRLPAKNYLIPVDGEGTYCLAFAATAAPVSILGNVQQQGVRVSFDLRRSTVGFTANKC